MSKQYQCNELFYSLQGEGVRAGTANVFVRFSGCNLRCNGGVEEGVLQPVCDTEFMSGRKVSLDEMAHWAGKAVQIALNRTDEIYGDGLVHGYDFWEEPWLILTGGEPALQVDQAFCDYWHERGVSLAIETNGTIELPKVEGIGYLLDWITVSPKTAEHTINQLVADEVKYLRSYGMGIPKPRCQAEHKLLSPHFEGDQVHPETMRWCQKLCLENPAWRLSVQQHKAWKVR